MTTSISI